MIKTLAALAAVDYPIDRWEAIVVDDGSPEAGMEPVRQWVEQSGAPIRYVRVPNGGPAKARNFGAARARGQILIFLDNDIIVGSDFIRLHWDTLRAQPGCWVFGRIVNPPELRRTPFGRFRDAQLEAFHTQCPSDAVSVVQNGLTAANLSVRTEEFRRLGGFNESFRAASGEDSELGIRASVAGIRILYHPLIVGLHNDWADTPGRYYERCRSYSRSDVLYWKMHGSRCPRARLVTENGPIDWKHDSGRLIAKKSLKRLLATRPSVALIRLGCRITEIVAPDSSLNHKAYNLLIGAGIFRGVCEGWRTYIDGPETGAASVCTPLRVAD